MIRRNWLAPGSGLFVRAAQAELDRDTAQARFHKRDAGYEAAATEHEAVLRELTAQPGGEALTKFLETVAAVRTMPV